MLIIFLPGFSPKNKTEMTNIAKVLESGGHEVYAHEWLHWNDEDIQFDEAVELSRILHEIETRNPETLTLVTKSIGTYEVLWLLEQIREKLTISKLVMMGIPVKDLATGQSIMYPQVLDKLKDTEIVVIQNSNDSHGTPEQVKTLFADVDFRLITKESDTHSYDYAADVLELLTQ